MVILTFEVRMSGLPELAKETVAVEHDGAHSG